MSSDAKWMCDYIHLQWGGVAKHRGASLGMRRSRTSLQDRIRAVVHAERTPLLNATAAMPGVAAALVYRLQFTAVQ